MSYVVICSFLAPRRGILLKSEESLGGCVAACTGTKNIGRRYGAPCAAIQNCPAAVLLPDQERRIWAAVSCALCSSVESSGCCVAAWSGRSTVGLRSCAPRETVQDLRVAELRDVFKSAARRAAIWCALWNLRVAELCDVIKYELRLLSSASISVVICCACSLRMNSSYELVVSAQHLKPLGPAGR